jgi:hypothetical protein
MSFSRPIQRHHSHADPIWPDGTFYVLPISQCQGLQSSTLSIHLFISGDVRMRRLTQSLALTRTFSQAMIIRSTSSRL